VAGNAANRALEARVVVRLKCDVDHVPLTACVRFASSEILSDLMAAGDAESSRFTVQIPMAQKSSLNPLTIFAIMRLQAQRVFVMKHLIMAKK
jgi:hypothetical protein